MAVWIGLLRRSSDWGLSPVQSILIQLAPLVALILLGLYLLFRLLYGVLTFGDHPHAAVALEKEVAKAKIELKKRGIIEG